MRSSTQPASTDAADDGEEDKIPWIAAASHDLQALLSSSRASFQRFLPRTKVTVAEPPGSQVQR
jgi:hypothetical protein